MQSWTSYLKRWIKAAVGFGLVAIALSAHAVTVLNLNDAGTAAVKISVKDPTRIRVEGAPITDILGSGVMTDKNPAGHLSVMTDETKGEVYIQPMTRSTSATSVFIVTGQSTYTLVLTPTDIPSDTIVIRDVASVPRENTTGKLPNHERELVRLLKKVASDRVSQEFQVTEFNASIALWNEVQFTHIRRYSGHPRYRVDVYWLTNISSRPMVLDEREFVTSGVAAVGLEQIELAPGDSTTVRIVRENEATR